MSASPRSAEQAGRILPWAQHCFLLLLTNPLASRGGSVPDGINHSLAMPHSKSKWLNFNQCRVGRQGRPLTGALASELISIRLFLLANPTKSSSTGRRQTGEQLARKFPSAELGVNVLRGEEGMTSPTKCPSKCQAQNGLSSFSGSPDYAREGGC